MSRVFVGNLPMDVKEREVEDLFYKYVSTTSISMIQCIFINYKSAIMFYPLISHIPYIFS